jgi:D-beta-D-heptose 7-phosphate kinase / D-beta-D-heptose 1-phosphate adenosyltransferase
MDISKVKSLLEKIKSKQPKILVLGDIMLDEYIEGDVDRISPEAPVPILNYNNTKTVLGGAGNVGSNLVNLGATVFMGSIIGKDNNGVTIKKLIESVNISTEGILETTNITSTKKTRFISKSTQLLRLDNDSKGIEKEDYEIFQNIINKIIFKIDCVIISDYDKGVCHESIIKNIIKNIKQKKIPIFIDPKGKDWSKYKNATCITPNLREIRQYLSSSLMSEGEFKRAAEYVIKKLNLKSCLITKGDQGMSFYSKKLILHQAVNKKEVFDVSGAGDTVIACFALSNIVGMDFKSSVELSAFISSEVVTHLGTTPFKLGMLLGKE